MKQYIIDVIFLHNPWVNITLNFTLTLNPYEAKEKYRGMFEIQKSGDKTSSGEIGLDIRTHASPKVGQDQVGRFLFQYDLAIKPWLMDWRQSVNTLSAASLMNCFAGSSHMAGTVRTHCISPLSNVVPRVFRVSSKCFLRCAMDLENTSIAGSSFPKMSFIFVLMVSRCGKWSFIIGY